MRVGDLVALTLAGWYLIMPNPVRKNASESAWVNLATFDSAKQCEAQKKQDAIRVHTYLRKNGTTGVAASELTSASDRLQLARLNELCVPANDPRLKK
jgi:hypothetical protein